MEVQIWVLTEILEGILLNILLVCRNSTCPSKLMYTYMVDVVYKVTLRCGYLAVLVVLLCNRSADYVLRLP